MKKVSSKVNKNAHTSNSKLGMGDNYGSGIRAKVGKVVDGMGMKKITPKSIKKPPKSLA